jgi:hypothetical protein
LSPGSRRQQKRSRRSTQSKRKSYRLPSNNGLPPMPMSNETINRLRRTVKNVYPRPNTRPNMRPNGNNMRPNMRPNGNNMRPNGNNMRPNMRPNSKLRLY